MNLFKWHWASACGFYLLLSALSVSAETPTAATVLDRYVKVTGGAAVWHSVHSERDLIEGRSLDGERVVIGRGGHCFAASGDTSRQAPSFVLRAKILPLLTPGVLQHLPATARVRAVSEYPVGVAFTKINSPASLSTSTSRVSSGA